MRWLIEMSVTQPFVQAVFVLMLLAIAGLVLHHCRHQRRLALADRRVCDPGHPDAAGISGEAGLQNVFRGDQRSNRPHPDGTALRLRSGSNLWRQGGPNRFIDRKRNHTSCLLGFATNWPGGATSQGEYNRNNENWRQLLHNIICGNAYTLAPSPMSTSGLLSGLSRKTNRETEDLKTAASSPQLERMLLAGCN